MYTGKDRRHYPRYKAESITVDVSFQGESNEIVCVERVNPIDFNRFGMAIDTNLELEIESNVFVDISRGKDCASDIICTVCYVQNQGKNNRYGLLFNFAANEYMSSEEVEEVLVNIEKILKKKHVAPYRNAYRRIKRSSA